MAPGLDCPANLLCSEFCGDWDDDSGSFCEEDNRDASQSLSAVRFADQAEVYESIALLAEKESSHMPQAGYLQMFQDRTLDTRARQNAVSWLLKVQAHYNFGPLTAALSVNYLDRFLSRHQLTGGKFWMLQLLSVACLSLASKMEEMDVPLLLDLQVEGAEFIFEPRTVQRMELLVLSTLEWRLSSVTPFSYMDYFISKLGLSEQRQRDMLSRTSDLVLNTLEEMRFLQYRPSSIAFAAALCAIEELLPMQSAECKQILLSLSIFTDLSERCFCLMEELFIEPFRRSLKRKAFFLASVPRSPIRVLDASFSCDSESTVRSLESSPSVVSSPAPKKKRNDHAFCNNIHSLQAFVAKAAAII